jgi:hypothetical protein
LRSSGLPEWVLSFWCVFGEWLANFFKYTVRTGEVKNCPRLAFESAWGECD